MLNLDPADLEKTYRSALESAALLRREGETAKATRVESVARVIERQLQRRRSSGTQQSQST
ncbi:MAG TPA: hypothetical protein VFV54_01355 [Thermoanaerobaculia bacterium]|nr:hypothetical protein [Thermoanaerobaculia bacterium]